MMTVLPGLKDTSGYNRCLDCRIREATSSRLRRHGQKPVTVTTLTVTTLTLTTLTLTTSQEERGRVC